MNTNKEKLIKIKELRTWYPIKKGVLKRTVGHVKAVNDVSIDIYKGEVVGIVGESGCGKTTFGKSILQLIDTNGGEILYNLDGKDVDLRKMSRREMNAIRNRIQIIFQNPYSSLNPAFTIAGSMEEPLIKFTKLNKKERREKIKEALADVNLGEQYMSRFPNELSGGQRQRIGIARALLVNPEFIVCDESVSALDVSIQAQVLKLLMELKENRNLTYMFITHDISVAEFISDRIVVMYKGNVVEVADTEEIFKNPLHPYTRALLSAVPIADVDQRKTRIEFNENDIYDASVPNSKPFNPDCEQCKNPSREVTPHLHNIGKDGKVHLVACNRYID